MTGLRPSEGRLTCPECGAQTSSGPLSTADLGEVDAAKKRGKKIWRAVRVATFDAWTAAVVGGSALAFGVVDHTSAIIGGAIMTVAIIEFKGAARLRKLDPAGALICGANQLLLLSVIGAYCAWNLLTQSSTSLTQSLGDPAGDALLADMAGLESKIRQGFYVLVLGGSVLMQGLMALYYFSRAGVVRRYVRETPPWVIELQRRAA
jgi:hypothetical protein